jgi:Tat protein translocase TatB subunit
MFNVGGGEVLVILLVALLVIGPGKLPDTARQIGNVLTQLKQMSSGFQNELKSAMDDIAPPTASTPPPAAPTADSSSPADTSADGDTAPDMSSDAGAIPAEGDDDPTPG